MPDRKRILVIYQGGTFGMVQTADADEGGLQPRDFSEVLGYLPELHRLPCDIAYESVPKPIDSSNVQPEDWVALARHIGERYFEYDGFVVLHGTDTMSYTASALSFLLENLGKPVILTGAVLPIDIVRSDARENFVLALEIASQVADELCEVAICFDARIYRGNRTIKYSSAKFQAFVSPNYPALAESAFTIEYARETWRPRPQKPFAYYDRMDDRVALLKYYPGLLPAQLEATLNIPNLRGLVLETYGNGNLPDFPWLLDRLRAAIERGLCIVNVTQCTAGRVEQGHYQVSQGLEDMGVLSGRDLTTAAALTKLMYLLGRYEDPATIRRLVETNLRGEMAE
jgi:L-asparaginase